MQGFFKAWTTQKETSLKSKTWISSPQINDSISVVFQALIKFKLQVS